MIIDKLLNHEDLTIVEARSLIFGFPEDIDDKIEYIVTNVQGDWRQTVFRIDDRMIAVDWQLDPSPTGLSIVKVETPYDVMEVYHTISTDYVEYRSL